jgi:hypothetical protein
MSSIVNNYFRVLEVISFLDNTLNTEIRVGRKFKISDLELAAFSLTSEFMSIDSEIYLLISYKIVKFLI